MSRNYLIAVLILCGIAVGLLIITVLTGSVRTLAAGWIFIGAEGVVGFIGVRRMNNAKEQPRD